jgi:glycerophosphoryl diester phosphodiesterase
MSTNRPLIIAHRGAAGEAPENTLAAFNLALEQGCDAIELDVHLSADGELIVCHDNDIDRTTTGAGKISEMTVTELKKYDAGLWFHEKYKNEKLPLLREVFDLVPNGIMINVEIKNIPSYYQGIEQKLLDLLIEKNRVHQVVVSSFDHKCLVRLKQLENDVKIGLLYYTNLIDHKGYSDLLGVPVYSLHPQFSAINQDDIYSATGCGLEVYPWTVNNEKEMKSLIDLGVTGIITDYPGKLKKLLNEQV